MSGSPCSSPPFSVKPQGAPPLSWTWMWWKETSCSTVSIPSLRLRRPGSSPYPLSLSPGWVVASSAAPAAVPRLLHHRRNNNKEWMDVWKDVEWVKEGEGRKFWPVSMCSKLVRHVGFNFRSTLLTSTKGGRYVFNLVLYPITRFYRLLRFISLANDPVTSPEEAGGTLLFWFM